VAHDTTQSAVGSSEKSLTEVSMKKTSVTPLKDLINPLEDDEQQAVVEFMESHGLKFTAIPNNTYTPYYTQKVKNEKMGLRAGFPDLVVIINKQFICIEMKRRKNFEVSKEQKAWHIALNETQVPAYVCHGSDEAIDLITQYMKGEVK
jgi:hypothetical protein